GRIGGWGTRKSCGSRSRVSGWRPQTTRRSRSKWRAEPCGSVWMPRTNAPGFAPAFVTPTFVRRPPGRRNLGMFEGWAHTMGGILEVAGIPGFLQNLDEFYEQVTHEATEVYAFVAEWWERHKSEPLTSKDLIPLADEVGIDLEAKTDRGRGIRL